MRLWTVTALACLLMSASAARAQTNAPAAPPQPVLTLETALRMALSNDHAIAISRGGEKISRLEFQQAKASFGPTLSLEGDYRQSEEPDTTDAFLTKFNPSESWNGWFRVSQSLLDARLFPARRREQAAWLASADDYTNAVRTRLLRVSASFYRAIQAQTIQAVADQAKQLADLEAQRASLRVQAGEARQTDLLRAQVDQSRAERVLNEARNEVVISARDLFRAVGLPAEATVSVQPPAPWPEPASDVLADLLQTCRVHRADIAAARHRIKAAEENLRVVQNDVYPKVELAFSEHVADPEIYSKGRDTWDVVVGAKFDLWDKGQRRTKRLQQLVRVEQARHQLGETEKLASAETERALSALAIARLNHQTAQREEDLATQNYNSLSEQARHGLATALDVSTALVDLTRARMDKVRLQYDVEMAKLALQAAIGQFPIPE